MKAVLSVFGVDQVGIVSKVTALLAEHGFNILDISQTIVGNYFTMIVIVEHEDDGFKLEDVVDSYTELGESLGLDIRMQHAALFDRMHHI
ncbi:ACT domain protein [Aedoeadaptatus nemausensis]|uniref:UPF0237 protein PEPNEM18_01284 n=1 Tax=Aedoeadaptatus nemausensis TaxID=2582829 RepID=A0A6V6Y5P2_9FIRM|nr:ACT domain-containing protein [Peptoniphilus nemausensis]CAC9933561.1 ACT domain protein [Peptoniphilus nemausensis]